MKRIMMVGAFLLGVAGVVVAEEQSESQLREKIGERYKEHQSTPPQHIQARIPPPVHTAERAGYPKEVSRFAHFANSPTYEGGWIGGGSSLGRGRGRTVQEGTWGWDYVGPGWYPGRVFTNWTLNGSNHQKGGTYKTDTKDVIDVFAIKKPEREEGGKEGGGEEGGRAKKKRGKE